MAPGQLSHGGLQVLMEWINTQLHSEHIVVRSLEEDMFDGLILHHLFRKWLLLGLPRAIPPDLGPQAPQVGSPLSLLVTVTAPPLQALDSPSPTLPLAIIECLCLWLLRTTENPLSLPSGCQRENRPVGR